MAQATKQTSKKKTSPPKKTSGVKNGASKKATNGKAENGEEKPKKKSLPPAKRIEVRLSRETDRLSKMVDRVEKWPNDEGENISEAVAAMKKAAEALTEAAESMSEVPDSYRPRVKRASRTNIEPGMILKVTDKRQKDYEGILEEDELTGLKALAVRGPRIMVETSDGNRLLIARGHLAVEKEESEADASDEE